MTAAGREVVAAAVDGVPDAIVITDTAGTVVYWNEGAERIFGFSPASMVGSALDRIIPERLRERHNQGFRAAMERGTSRYGPEDLLAVPALTADGRTISIEFSIALLAGDGGGIGHVTAVIRDVTARRERELAAKKRIAALEERLSELGG